MRRLGNKLLWWEVCWEPRDLWVGLFVTRKRCDYGTTWGHVSRELHVWVCLLPCLPLHIILGLPDAGQEEGG